MPRPGAGYWPDPVRTRNPGAVVENKIRAMDASVDDFLNAATPARRRADGEALDMIFREVTGVDPVLGGPSIVGYGSAHYVSPANPRSHGDWMKTGLSPHKAQLSIYGRKDTPEGAALLPQLGAYTGRAAST